MIPFEIKYTSKDTLLLMHLKLFFGRGERLGELQQKRKTLVNSNKEDLASPFAIEITNTIYNFPRNCGGRNSKSKI